MVYLWNASSCATIVSFLLNSLGECRSSRAICMWVDTDKLIELICCCQRGFKSWNEKCTSLSWRFISWLVVFWKCTLKYWTGHRVVRNSKVITQEFDLGPICVITSILLYWFHNIACTLRVWLSLITSVDIKQELMSCDKLRPNSTRNNRW